MADQLDCILDLCRRLPPSRIAENVDTLVELCPDLAEDILSSVDVPLKIKHDLKAAKPYLVCDYNKDGDSYRSPWTNAYDPPLADGTVPSPKLRKLEEAANDAFDVYREMYYDGGISSVYLWDLDDDNFAGVVLLQKGGVLLSPLSRQRAHAETPAAQDPSKKTNASTADASSSWDSIHVFEAHERGRSAHYRLTSTVMLRMATTSAAIGTFELSGSLTRQNEQDATFDPSVPTSHIANLGRYIEEQELKMRSALQEVYLQKTRNIVNELRSMQGLDEGRRRQGLQSELVGLLKRT